MCILAMTMMVVGSAVPARAQAAGQPFSAVGESLEWSGKGDVGVCEFGYQLVLTPGGNTTISNATLDVDHVVAKAEPGAWRFFIGPGHTHVTVTFDWVSNLQEPNFQFVASRCLDDGEFPGVPPVAPVTVTIVKAWVVASDPAGLFDVKATGTTFLVDGQTIADGGTIVAQPGTVLRITEQVTGLPTVCSYQARLNGSGQLVHTVGDHNETVTITNEVTCPAPAAPPGPDVPPGPGVPPGPELPPVPPPAAGPVEVPAVGLVKDVDVPADDDGTPRVVFTGDDDTVQVTYTYTVTNEGGTPLTLTELTDDQLAGVDVTIFDTDTLAPGESTTGTFTTILTADDFDADGRLLNVAVVRAVAPDGRVVTDQDDALLELIEVREVVAPGRPDAPVEVVDEVPEDVEAVREMLPVTGGSILHLLTAGLAALLLGAGLLVAGRQMSAHANSGASADASGNAAGWSPARRTVGHVTSGAEPHRGTRACRRRVPAPDGAAISNRDGPSRARSPAMVPCPG